MTGAPAIRADEASALDEARAALAAGDWDGALRAVQGIESRTAAVLEVTAQAAYGAGDLETTIAALEELHALQLEAGDTVAAAHAAAMVAMYVMMDTGLMAPVRAWLARAEGLLAGAEESAVSAWVAMVRTYERLLSGDLEGGRRFSRVAVELGLRFDVRPAVAIGRTAVARIAIFDRRIDEGLALLDDVAVMLMSGEVDPLTTGMVYCELICAMQGLAQYDRAEQWTEAMERWRLGQAFGGINGRCRVHRAEILRLRGPCDDAEAEALRACDELRPWMRREFGWPLTELGNIRLRKGDLAGAEEAFVAANEHLWEPQPGLALLRLAQGDVAAASALIRDALEHPLAVPSKERPPFGELRRAPLLDAQVQIAVAAGDVACAKAAAEELAHIADDFRSAALHAAASLARARVALAAGDPVCATREAAAAADAWAAIGAPYETATARFVLAGAWRAAGDAARGEREAEAARAIFDRLGAVALTPAAPSDRVAAPPAVAAACAFRCEGDVRAITFGGLTVRLKDLKGMRYLAILFAHPGREFHVLDLVAREAGTGAHDVPDFGHEVDDGGAVIDDAARAAYRRRLRDIEEDIEEATHHHDDARRALAEADRDYLLAELAHSFGLGGRRRRSGLASERARLSVARTLKYAVERIAAHHPALGEHLARTLRTGTYVAYEPDPLANITWDMTAAAR